MLGSGHNNCYGGGGWHGGPFSPSDLVHLIDEEIKTQKVKAACYVRLSKCSAKVRPLYIYATNEDFIRVLFQSLLRRKVS